MTESRLLHSRGRLQQTIGAKMEAVAKKVSVPFGGAGAGPKKPAPMLKPGMKSQSIAMGMMNIAANMGTVSLPMTR